MTEKKALNIMVGENIKREREKAGFTQEEFSELIDLGPKSLSAIERGVVGISLSSLKKVCDVLSISSDTLIFGDIPTQDVRDLADCLARLSPKKYEIANDVMSKLLQAFALDDDNG